VVETNEIARLLRGGKINLLGKKNTVRDLLGKFAEDGTDTPKFKIGNFVSPLVGIF